MEGGRGGEGGGRGVRRMVKRGGDTASFTSPESVVINNVYAKTGASGGAEQLLNNLLRLPQLQGSSADSVLFIEQTPNLLYLETGLHSPLFFTHLYRTPTLLSRRSDSMATLAAATP
jgi:hypothetical protein